MFHDGSDNILGLTKPLSALPNKVVSAYKTATVYERAVVVDECDTTRVTRGQPTFLGMSHSPSNAKGSQMSGDTQMSGDVVSYLARSFMDERGAAILTTVVVVAVIATFLVNLIRRIRDKD